MATMVASSPAASTSVPIPPAAGRRRRPAVCSADRKALFNRIAPRYDDLNDLLSLGQHRIWKRMAVSWSGARSGDTALDICCGSGDLAFLLSEKVGLSGKVIGFDFSEHQLAIASGRQVSSGRICHKNIKWMEGDALKLPFPDKCFDAVTIGYGLRNVVDRLTAMREIYRVLKPGSRVSVLDFNKSTNDITFMLQDWILDYIVVPMASSYGLTMEYDYLKNSIKEFLTGHIPFFVLPVAEHPFLMKGNELEELAKDVGFSEAKHYEIGAGFMGTLVARR